VRRYDYVAATLVAVVFVFGIGRAVADGTGDPKSVKDEGGKYSDKDGNPTYHVGSDGTVDWYTYSGFRRYHSDCHVCHGPDGEGSSYAPALKDSLKAISYFDFFDTVVDGRKNVNTASDNVMPAFGTNPNVMCEGGKNCHHVPATILAFRVRSRASLELELIALRHQVTVLRRQRPGRLDAVKSFRDAMMPR
jgi:methanol metabolism-related c-type cytochrome